MIIPALLPVLLKKDVLVLLLTAMPLLTKNQAVTARPAMLRRMWMVPSLDLAKAIKRQRLPWPAVFVLRSIVITHMNREFLKCTLFLQRIISKFRFSEIDGLNHLTTIL